MTSPKNPNQHAFIGTKKHRYDLLRKRLRQNFRQLTESHRTRQEETIRRGHMRRYNPLLDSQFQPEDVKKRSFSFAAIITDGVFYKNPVLFHALGVAPIIGAGTTLFNGIALSLLTFGLLFPISLLTSLLGRNFKPPQRLVLYVILSSFLLIPASSFLQYNFPDILNSLGIFLPLVSVSALISVRAEAFAVRNSAPRAMVDSFAVSVGFALVICLVASVRELLTFGTIGGMELIENLSFSPASMSFFGFFLLGLAAACGRMIRNTAIAKKVVLDEKKGGRAE